MHRLEKPGRNRVDHIKESGKPALQFLKIKKTRGFTIGIREKRGTGWRERTGLHWGGAGQAMVRRAGECGVPGRGVCLAGVRGDTVMPIGCGGSIRETSAVRPGDPPVRYATLPEAGSNRPAGRGPPRHQARGATPGRDRVPLALLPPGATCRGPRRQR